MRTAERRHTQQTFYDDIINCQNKMHELEKVSSTPFIIEGCDSVNGEPRLGIQYRCKNCWYTEYKETVLTRGLTS